jgi:hypothetical protein
VKSVQQQTSYEVTAACDNCLWFGKVSVNFGSLVAQKPCPLCGCAKLKAMPQMMWSMEVAKPQGWLK